MNINTQIAVETYYSKPELENRDIRTLLGVKSGASVAKFKELARQEMVSQGMSTFSKSAVNTDCAYTAWNLNIEELKARYKALKSLGLAKVTEQPLKEVTHDRFF